jgi:alkylation response protein AidB-like acyl-CoA dehydrogenase
MGRKAVSLAKAGDADAERFKTMSRVFAREVANCVARNAIQIMMGTGAMDASSMSEFMAAISYNELINSNRNLLRDMDAVAEMVFEK